VSDEDDPDGPTMSSAEPATGPTTATLPNGETLTAASHSWPPRSRPRRAGLHRGRVPAEA